MASGGANSFSAEALKAQPPPAPAPGAAAAAAALRQRKKPHMLPPLEKRRNSDIPQSECYRAEVGSPTPKWRRPSLEEQLILEEPPTAGRPAIRLTPAPASVAGSPPSSQPPPTVPSQPPLQPGPPPGPPPPAVGSRYAPLDPIKPKAKQEL